MKHLFATTAFALALLTGATQAGTITYTARGSETVSVPMFDPAMGFLTAVDYRMIGSSDAQEWSDPGFNGNGVSARAQAKVFISFLNRENSGTDMAYVECTDLIYSPGRAPECQGHVTASAYAFAELSQSLSIENGDNVPFRFSGLRQLTGRVSGYSSYRSSIGPKATLSITYTFADAPPDPLPAAYAALPLPASAPLLLVGLGGIAALRRRARKRVK